MCQEPCYGGLFTASGGSPNVGVRATGSDVGVEGISSSGVGTGVHGEAGASGTGVQGTSTSGTGVYGESSASGYGVRGNSLHGTGVYGSSSVGGLGVEGISVLGTGVYGEHMATTRTDPGVHGVTRSTDPGAAGVLGEGPSILTTGDCYGVHGKSADGPGVYGEHTGGGDIAAVRGFNATTPFIGFGGEFEGGWIGVIGNADLGGEGSRAGGSFHASNGDGENVGIIAYGTDTGVRGSSSSGYGIHGEST